MATGGATESGFQARAGALTLLYLSSPLERPVLRTVMAELTTGVKVQEIEEPDPEFMVMGVFEDSYLLEPADPDHPPGEPIGPDTMMRPTPAGREVPFVGAVLARWLRRCPEGPLELGPESRRHMAALLGGWASMTIHALAGGPHSAAQACEAIQVLDREVIDARIDSMLDTGLLEEAPGAGPDGEPLVGPTEWLRRGIAPLAAAARMELRFPPGDTAPIGALSLPPSREYLAHEIENVIAAYDEMILSGLELEEGVVPGELRRHSGRRAKIRPIEVTVTAMRNATSGPGLVRAINCPPGYETLPRGTTHRVRCPVSSAMRSKSLS